MEEGLRRLSDIGALARADPDRSFVRLIHPFTFDPRKRKWGGVPATWHLDDAPAELELLATARTYLQRDCVLAVMDRNRGVRSYEKLGGHAEWQVVGRRRKAGAGIDGAVPFVFEDVHLSLFPTGVGFVAITVRPCTDDIAEWATALHALRFTDGLRSHLLVRRPVAEGTTVPWSPVVRGGGDDFTPEWARATFDDLFEMLLDDWALSTDPAYVPGRALTYSAIFTEGLTEGSRRLVRNALVSHFHGGQPVDDASAPDAQGWLTFAGASGFGTTAEGSIFVGDGLPQVEFFEAAMPSLLRREYGLIFLLAAHERFVLLRFLGGLADLRRRHRRQAGFEQFGAVRAAMQALQLERHRRYSTSCTTSFGTSELYANVEALVAGMNADANRSLENLLLGAFAAPAIALGWLGVNIDGITASGGLPIQIAIAALVGAYLMLGFTVYYARRASG
jgi:hypothetical protein